MKLFLSVISLCLLIGSGSALQCVIQKGLQPIGAPITIHHCPTFARSCYTATTIDSCQFPGKLHSGTQTSTFPPPRSGVSPIFIRQGPTFPTPLHFWRNGKNSFRHSSFDAMDQLVLKLNENEDLFSFFEHFDGRWWFFLKQAESNQLNN